MKKNNKYHPKYRRIFLLKAIALSAVFSTFSLAHATTPISTSANCDSVTACLDQAAIVRSIIDIKKKQTEIIGNKISSTNSSLQDVKAQIQTTGNQIDDLNAQINELEKQIEAKKTLIASNKELLVQMIQAYYQISQTNPVAIYLSEDNLASFMVNKDRISQTGDKINQTIENLNNLRAQIQQQSDQLAEKKAQLVSAHQELQSKNDNFEAIKKQQTSLLVQTQGEQAQYSQLLKNIEEQKAQLLDIDQFFAASGLSADSYPKPDSKYTASTGWYFSQRDPQWGGMTIGNTKTLMKSYGCAVTSVAMVFKEHGGSVTPGKLAKESIFSGDLINWPSSWDNPKLNLSGDGKSHKNIDWSIIDAQIAKSNPVIVYIGRSNGSGGHYVVVHHKDSKGKYVVHDPYFGANIFLDTSRALIGAMGSSSSTYIDQMIIYN
jgi:peptidoglycan hydrolase CwlO-like protein